MSVFEIFRENKTKEYSESDVSEHYKKLSIRCAIMKWLVLMTLVIFVVVSVSVNGDALSLDSIRYIVRYMKDTPVSLTESGDGVIFDYDNQNKAYNIGEDFAIVGSDGIIIYDYSGEVLYNEDLNYTAPAAVSYDKELIVYDVGGKEVRFYNSYSMVKRLTLDYPVYSVDVSTAGNYLIQTASSGYRTGFQVYNSSKQMIFRHNYGELTLQTVSISANGKYVSSASFSTVSSKVSTYLSIYDVSQKDPISELTVDGEYPIHIDFIDDSIILFTDKGVRGYNTNLDSVFVEYYGEKSPQQFKVAEDQIVLTYKSSLFNQSTDFFIIDKNGENTKRFTVPYSVYDYIIDGEMIHILQDNTIDTYSLSELKVLKSENLNKTFTRIIKINSEKFMISKADEAQIFIFNN